jgi:hypothetical protein
MHARTMPALSWRKPGLLFLSILALLAAACTTVSLVSPYDEQTEQGLSGLYVDTSNFVDRMISLHGQPAGTFAANQQFYSDAMARVDVMIARSQGFSVRDTCPSTTFMAGLTERLPSEVRARVGTLPPGDCQTVVLTSLRGAYDDMRTFHRAQGDRGIPESARDIILTGGVGSLLRTAIAIQAAKHVAAQNVGAK